MNWPERPTCHDGDQHAQRFGQPNWQGGIAPPPRSCSYCGSIHPEDLLAYLATGGTLGGADWKYDWPHKFYLRDASQPPIKWYNEHILDVTDKAALGALLLALEMHGGVRFEVREVGGERRLCFHAPHEGYQR
jgi:hypothetical protein